MCICTEHPHALLDVSYEQPPCAMPADKAQLDTEGHFAIKRVWLLYLG